MKTYNEWLKSQNELKEIPKLNDLYIYDISNIDKKHLSLLKDFYDIKDLGGHYLQYTFSYGWALFDDTPEICIIKKL